MKIQLIRLLDKYVGNLAAILIAAFKKEDINRYPKKILVIQTWGIGETILTLPAISEIRKKFPKAQIDVLCLERVKAVYEGWDFIDNLIQLSMSPFAIVSYMTKQWKQYDLVIDFEEYLRITGIIASCVGKTSLGYQNRGKGKLFSLAIKYGEDQHVAETHLDLARVFKDVKPITSLLPPPYPQEEEKKVDALFTKHKITQSKLFGLAPGAAESARARMWDKERYAALADKLLEKHPDAKILLLGGPGEKRLCQEVIDLMKNKNAIDLAETTSLKGYFALVKRLDLLVANDSGPMHIGAAMGIKTIGLFGPNIPLRWGAFGSKCKSLYEGDICKYSPCVNPHKGQVPECLWGKNHENYAMCMKNLSVQKVCKAAEEML